MNASVSIDVATALPANEHPLLLPTQKVAFDQLLRFSAAAPVTMLSGPRGHGTSTILRRLCEELGGVFIGVEQATAAARASTEQAGDTITRMIGEAYTMSDLIVIEDMLAINLSGIRWADDHFQFARRLAIARKPGRKIIMGVRPNMMRSVLNQSPHRAWPVIIDRLKEQDYRQFLVNRLGSRAEGIDTERLYRQASSLNGYELRRLCTLLARFPFPGIAEAVDILETHLLRSNTRVEEVEELRFDDLPGAEHIAEKLETHVVLPLQNAKLSERLGLKPKRGVLLYGPPGTGKTSIGRALAHRMKSRFFLIDGSIVTEPPAEFFAQVEEIITDAQKNAPCVLFIDDADVLFGIVHISGFARFLLTLLDGMESESAGKVCVMMTAMDVTKVPSAILRSGRIELWLETRPPNVEIRAAILKKWIGVDLPGHESIDYLMVAEHAEGFTPADLRRIIGDARAYYAADEVAGRPIQRADAYLSRSVVELIATRARMADNLRDDSLRVGKLKVRAKYGSGIGGIAEADTSCTTKGW